MNYLWMGCDCIKAFEDLAGIDCPPEIEQMWCNDVLCEILKKRVKRIVRPVFCICILVTNFVHSLMTWV